MNIFEWMNGGPQLSEVDRAIRLVHKQDTFCSLDPNVKIDDSHVVLMGTYKRTLRGKYFKYFTVKFSQDGNSSMISSNGSPDFFFSTPEETVKLKEAIKTHF